MTIKFYFFLICLANILFARAQKDEEAANEFLNRIDKKFSELYNMFTIANWNYATNLTDENLKIQLVASDIVANKTKKLAAQIDAFPWRTYTDKDLKRTFEVYHKLGMEAVPLEKITKIVSEMETIYSKAKICSFQDKDVCNLNLEPDIYKILEKSEDPEELKYVWTEWRKATGQKVKNLFQKYVELSNEAARINNFTDNTEYWLLDYEDPEFQSKIFKLWKQVRPLYEQIHAYARNRLREKYGEEIVSKKGPIPAHLLGNVWAQSWSHIYKFLIPYPDAQTEDVTEEMVKQEYTPLKMFEMADDFFTSINLTAMPELFWRNSIIEKPSDGREMVCHASAWDFYDQEDFRIKQCTRINQEDFFTVHHEMGHIQYYLQYSHLPVGFRKGANPGFHEAVGDVMSLSVSTNKHLHKIGLLKEYVDNKETTINSLLQVGLDKIVFLPFAYILDAWRWDVFSGKISPEKYNSEWWKLRENIQGIKAPVTRTENDFDPGSKYHIVANVPYVRYFVSFIIQFQFHKALCELAGQYEIGDPDKALHKCDIYQSVEAGNALGNMLKLGSSKPWQDAMETLTGGREMDASALLEYFQPLQDWLVKENRRTGEHIGWDANE